MKRKPLVTFLLVALAVTAALVLRHLVRLNDDKLPVKQQKSDNPRSQHAVVSVVSNKFVAPEALMVQSSHSKETKNIFKNGDNDVFGPVNLLDPLEAQAAAARIKTDYNVWLSISGDFRAYTSPFVGSCFAYIRECAAVASIPNLWDFARAHVKDPLIYNVQVSTSIPSRKYNLIVRQLCIAGTTSQPWGAPSLARRLGGNMVPRRPCGVAWT